MTEQTVKRYDVARASLYPSGALAGHRSYMKVLSLEDHKRAISALQSRLDAERAENSNIRAQAGGMEMTIGELRQQLAEVHALLREIVEKVGPSVINKRQYLEQGEGCTNVMQEITGPDWLNKAGEVLGVDAFLLSASAEPASPWIAATERLPDEHKADYLCLFEDGSQQVSEWLHDDTEGWCFWYGNPTHWMPLPDAPAKGDGEVQ